MLKTAFNYAHARVPLLVKRKEKGICTLAWHNIKLQNTFLNSIETFLFEWAVTF